MKLDLNADLGEGMETDTALMQVVSSANIACGRHAGDAATMRITVARALKYGVGIGAHPGYDDAENFGRLALSLPASEIINLVATQVRDLMVVAEEAGGRLQHVKPHGALSNQAMRDFALAEALAQGIKVASRDLIFLAPAGTAMVRAGRRAGLTVMEELFADRAYDDAGCLVPRNQPGAVLHDAGKIAARLLAWLKTGSITTVSGGRLQLSAQSVCVHGDTPEAVEIAVALRERLEAARVAIVPLAMI